MLRSIKINNRVKKNKVDWIPAPDIEKRIIKLLKVLEVGWVKREGVYCFRSANSKTKAYARIWGLSRIWQKALNVQPAYIIEVISEKFDKLSDVEKDKVLIHELTHIPRNFSGSLLPHIRRGKRNFQKKVDILIGQYLRDKK